MNDEEYSNLLSSLDQLNMLIKLNQNKPELFDQFKEINEKNQNYLELLEQAFINFTYLLKESMYTVSVYKCFITSE